MAHKWTPEELDTLRTLYQKHTKKECANLMGFTEGQVKSALQRHHITCGRSGRFSKGHVPANKGKKMSPETYRKVQPTMFKKGHAPTHHRPVGSERVTVDGYVEVKVAEPNKWRLKHRVVYEEHFGPLKSAEAVIILNGNRQDLRPENLMKLTRAELARLNLNHLHSFDTELGRSKALIAKILSAKGKRNKSDE